MGAAGTVVFSFTDEWYHRRLRHRQLGFRARRPRAPQEASLPGGAALVQRAGAPRALRVSQGLGGHLRLQRGADHGGLSRIPAQPSLSRLRGRGRGRRLHRPHRRHRGQLRGLSRHPPAEQGAQRRAQRRHRGVDSARSSPSPTRTASWIRTGCTTWSRRFSRPGSPRWGGPTCRRPKTRWWPRAWPPRPAGRLRCCSTTWWPSTSRAATWRSGARCSTRSAASIRSTARAGDDVDVCWRLQDLGYRIGFSPAAMVWHFRRNTMKAYIGQQKGYGKAEALLYFKPPSALQRARPVALARAHLRRHLRPLLAAPARHLLRRVRPGALPDPLPAALHRPLATCPSRSSGTWSEPPSSSTGP